MSVFSSLSEYLSFIEDVEIFVCEYLCEHRFWVKMCMYKWNVWVGTFEYKHLCPCVNESMGMVMWLSECLSMFVWRSECQYAHVSVWVCEWECTGGQVWDCLSVKVFWLMWAVPWNCIQKEMATHSSVLAWRIPGMGEPGGLPSMGSHRVGNDWSDLA